MIIDFHTHTFPGKISAKVVDHLSRKALIHPFTDGSVIALTKSMKEAGIDYSVSLPVVTDITRLKKINSSYIDNVDYFTEQGIIPFGGMHPDYENYKEELRRLKDAGIRGIKLHPAYQGIDLDDIRTMRILEAASSEGLIILIHAGIDIGIYDRNYASVGQILTVIKEVAPEKLVLAHFGNWGCWDEVERDLAGAPVWFDISFSLGPLVPRSPDGPGPEWSYNLPDEDFIRIARKHGTDKILFATDSPWSDQKDYVRRINRLALTDEERKAVFSENALDLLALSDIG